PDINLYAIYPKSMADEQKINLLLSFICEKALSENIATSFIYKNN
ncbi:TPA: LysR family transcriptional regulator, partial [Legionella pneumophila]|nr:LysR family transcriptional regulator [Legionella pneumophila]